VKLSIYHTSNNNNSIWISINEYFNEEIYLISEDYSKPSEEEVLFYHVHSMVNLYLLKASLVSGEKYRSNCKQTIYNR
jgi:hypothetical protein